MQPGRCRRGPGSPGPGADLSVCSRLLSSSPGDPSALQVLPKYAAQAGALTRRPGGQCPAATPALS
eukprot:276377-Hanusia_phi.AAC.1